MSSKFARFGSLEDVHLDLWELATRQEPAIGTKGNIVDRFTTYCEGEEGRAPGDQRSYVDELKVSFGDEGIAFCAVLSIMAFMVRGTSEMDHEVSTRFQDMADSMRIVVRSTNRSLQLLGDPAVQYAIVLAPSCCSTTSLLLFVYSSTSRELSE